MKFLPHNTRHHAVITLPSPPGMPERVHAFDEQSIAAVNAALAAQRPLLVRGEPGVGKTQLAEAVAARLRRAFYPFTVDSRTESRDVLWRFDAVMRLARAQLCAALHEDAASAERQLAVTNFVHPGPLWWAFDAQSAQAANGGRPPPGPQDNARRMKNGWVVLIDEIDKAESDVPNGLLEALGAGQFTPEGWGHAITVTGVPPLIFLTTNEERVLPDAFLRRCLVLHLALPREDKALMTYLQQRGKEHFGTKTHETVLEEAARQLLEDRRYAEQEQLSPLPGQAEYLDLLRVVIGQAPHDVEKQKTLLDKARLFTLRKHPTMGHRAPEARL